MDYMNTFKKLSKDSETMRYKFQKQ